TEEANDGIYSWTTPDLSDLEVRIRVTATDLASNTSSDISDADFRLSAHDNWIVLHLIGGNNQVGGIEGTLPVDLKMIVGNGAGSQETFAGADDVTVTFTLSTTPTIPTATGQALTNGTFGTTFGGTSTAKTVSTDANGYVSAVFTLGDRAGDYTVIADFTLCETLEADRTFAATEREIFNLSVSDLTSNLNIDPAVDVLDSTETTLSVITNAASFQITLDPDMWLTNPSIETISNWIDGLGFGWDNNGAGTSGSVTVPTAFPGGLDASNIYTCLGDTCQGTSEFTFDLHAAIDYLCEGGTYEDKIDIKGVNISF
ncbi:hypothetical protein KAI54_04225, partial [Candidatus Gracilibacteria bacterium]|nr:hypothetical protein [Candidatus Gracilibacteria bacterium]